MQYYHMEYNTKRSTINSSTINNRRNTYKRDDIKLAGKRETPIDIHLYKDKWQQLIKAYPQVHICNDAESILIKPKDTIILREQYHDLSTNSFLLHAYYNYRQLLLFRYMENGEYYLAVPGIYDERQRRVAILFGFEGFENGNGDKNETGAFGYYMRRVEI